jgi:predicted phage replisome organizer
MINVKRIKVSTNVFNDEKIAIIEAMPEGDTLIVIWFKLLCMAGTHNNKLILSNGLPLDCKMLATILRRDKNIVKTALNVFENLIMLKFENGIYSIIEDKTPQELRNTYEYKEWRKDVFARDNYTCKLCGKRGVYLNAHHKKSFAKYPDLQTQLENGITLCYDCHKQVHKKQKKKKRVMVRE